MDRPNDLIMPQSKAARAEEGRKEKKSKPVALPSGSHPIARTNKSTSENTPLTQARTFSQGALMESFARLDALLAKRPLKRPASDAIVKQSTSNKRPKQSPLSAAVPARSLVPAHEKVTTTEARDATGKITRRPSHMCLHSSRELSKHHKDKSLQRRSGHGGLPSARNPRHDRGGIGAGNCTAYRDENHKHRAIKGKKRGRLIYKSHKQITPALRASSKPTLGIGHVWPPQPSRNTKQTNGRQNSSSISSGFRQGINWLSNLARGGTGSYGPREVIVISDDDDSGDEETKPHKALVEPCQLPGPVREFARSPHSPSNVVIPHDSISANDDTKRKRSTERKQFSNAVCRRNVSLRINPPNSILTPDKNDNTPAVGESHDIPPKISLGPDQLSKPVLGGNSLLLITPPSSIGFTPDENDNTSTVSPKPSLLTIPLEIRDEIYRYLLCTDDPVRLMGGWSSLFPYKQPAFHAAIIEACKQTALEAPRILYSENTFRYILDDGGGSGRTVAATTAAKGRKAVSGRTPRRIDVSRYGHLFRRLEIVLEPYLSAPRYRANLARAIQDLNSLQQPRPRDPDLPCWVGGSDGGAGGGFIHTLTLTLSPCREQNEMMVLYPEERELLEEEGEVQEEQSQLSHVRFFGPRTAVVTALRRLRCNTIQIFLRTEEGRCLRSRLDMRYCPRPPLVPPGAAASEAPKVARNRARAKSRTRPQAQTQPDVGDGGGGYGRDDGSSYAVPDPWAGDKMMEESRKKRAIQARQNLEDLWWRLEKACTATDYAIGLGLWEEGVPAPTKNRVGMAVWGNTAGCAVFARDHQRF